MKFTIEIAEPLDAYLADLSATGLYGATHEDVAADLVRTGVISAISSGLIDVRHDGEHDRYAPPVEDAPTVAEIVNPAPAAKSLDVPSTLPTLTPLQANIFNAVKTLLQKGEYFTQKELLTLGGTSASAMLYTLEKKGYLRNTGERGAPRWEICIEGEPVVAQWIAGAQNSKRNTQPRKHLVPARRFTEHKELTPEKVGGLPSDHSAITEARTLFPSTVVSPQDSPRLLVSGQHSRKLGSHVTKGPWADFPIYQLTLEERATCPKTCAHWTSCYGNGMPQSRRHAHGDDLIYFLRGELTDLQDDHPEGFVVRLHVLGDFYSVDYVAAWFGFIKLFPALHIFGYTAWPRSSEIGAAVKRITDKHWDRFAIRFSDAEPKPQGATTIWRQPEADNVPEGIVCPAQTGKTDCCGTCGLCWSEPMREKTIVFVAHGPKFNQKSPDEAPPPVALVEEVTAEPIVEEPLPAPCPLTTIEKIKAAAEKQSGKSPRIAMGEYLKEKGVHVAVLGKGRYEARGEEMDLAELIAFTNELRTEDGLPLIETEDA